MVGLHIDLNILHHSTTFMDFLANRSYPKKSIISCHMCLIAYYLHDYIYPNYVALIGFVRSANRKAKEKEYFMLKHEAPWEEVERAFSVLKA